MGVVLLEKVRVLLEMAEHRFIIFSHHPTVASSMFAKSQANVTQVKFLKIGTRPTYFSGRCRCLQSGTHTNFVGLVNTCRNE